MLGGHALSLIFSPITLEIIFMIFVSDMTQHFPGNIYLINVVKALDLFFQFSGKGKKNNSFATVNTCPF